MVHAFCRKKMRQFIFLKVIWCSVLLTSDIDFLCALLHWKIVAFKPNALELQKFQQQQHLRVGTLVPSSTKVRESCSLSTSTLNAGDSVESGGKNVDSTADTDTVLSVVCELLTYVSYYRNRANLAATLQNVLSFYSPTENELDKENIGRKISGAAWLLVDSEAA